MTLDAQVQTKICFTAGYACKWCNRLFSDEAGTKLASGNIAYIKGYITCVSCKEKKIKEKEVKDISEITTGQAQLQTDLENLYIYDEARFILAYVDENEWENWQKTKQLAIERCNAEADELYETLRTSLGALCGSSSFLV